MRNDTGTFSQVVPISTHGSGSILMPIGLDGSDQLSIFHGETAVDFGGNSYEPFFIEKLSTDLLTVLDVTEMPVPIFDGATFADVESYFDDGNSHDIATVSFDIDGDGDKDLIVSSMIWGPDNFGVLQIYVNDGGTYIDETGDRLFNWSMMVGGVHRLEVLDVNGDGHLDILTSDMGIRGATSNPNKVLVNDGTGHFLNVISQQMVHDDIGEYSTYIPRLTPDGILQWTAFTLPGTGNVEVMTITMDEALSTGPNMTNPTAAGAPGFNEFYYLQHNADVRQLITAGDYSTGLEHYLAVGQTEGRMPNAS
jgi:hypothetical protein